MPKAKENSLLRVKEDLDLAVKKHSAGQLPEAEKLYRKVLNEQPTNQVVLNNLATMANQVGKHEMAVELCKQSLAINSGNAIAYNNLGNALARLGRVEEALTSYRNALRIKPNYHEALHNAGVELERAGRSAEAVSPLMEAIKINPKFIDAYNALGISLHSQGRLAEAINAYRAALKIKPHYILALNNLGNSLSSMDRIDEAIASYKEALRIKPNYFEAFNNMGNALARVGRIDEAIVAFNAALVINPGLAESRSSLTMWKQSACDWSNAEQDDKAFLDCARLKPWGIDPFFFLSQNSTHADQLLVTRHFARKFSIPPSRRYTHKPDKKDRKIRIAYISGNFQRHPNAYLSAGLFERHDRKKFEVIAYSYGKSDNSDIRKRLEKSFDRFYDIHELTHAEAAAKINADGIDILIDRQGYTTGHRIGILAHRPAPIQVNYLGYPGTMGTDFLDYVIADPYVVPMDQQQYFTEKLVHLPNCYQGTDDKQLVAERVPTRAECGLPEDAFVFCCFNNTHKIRSNFFDIWMRLLKEVPGSVLWILNKNKLVKDNLTREAQRRGVDPNRLVFASTVPHPDHLARHRLADLFLDTLPYNAHTTASDALWTGLPIITCVGNTFAGRVAYSILKAINLPELVTESLQDYEALALKLAKEPKEMAKIRKKLEKNRLSTPLFNTQLYTDHLEESYLQMWKIWQSGGQPQPIIVQDIKK